MSGVSICRVVGVGRLGLGGYQPGVYVPLKALFLVKIWTEKKHEHCKQHI